MRISTLTYFLVFILAMANYSFSQEIELPREEMAVHLSQHCVASGDELWVSVYVSNAKDLPDAQISSLAFVELVDTENNSLVRKKVLLEKGIGTCSFVIPESFEGNLKSDKKIDSSLTFAKYNVTARKNAYSVFYRSEGERLAGYKLSVFATAIPTISYNFKF